MKVLLWILLPITATISLIFYCLGYLAGLAKRLYDWTYSYSEDY